MPLERKATVRVLESGVVGSLDYKIIVADDANGLFDWLKENKYSYGGDRSTLDFYIKKKWFFTVMKIDPKQMKKLDQVVSIPEGTQALSFENNDELRSRLQNRLIITDDNMGLEWR